jgi:hypothetical protein
MITSAAWLHVELNPRLPWQSNIQQKEDSFYQQTGLKFKEEASNVLYLYRAET